MADGRREPLARRPEWPPRPAMDGAADDDDADDAADEAAAAPADANKDADELGRLFESRVQVKDDDDGGEGEEDEKGASDESDSDESDDDDEAQQQALLRALAGLAPLAPPQPPPLPKNPRRLLPSLDLPGVAAYLRSDACRRVVFMVGAGASTSAGIPDFRSPGTGLYANLQSLGLPHPEAVFDVDFFRRNPRPFYTLAKSLYPATTARATTTTKKPPPPPPPGPRPTAAHHFFELVRRKGKLRRVFTQNIDALEHAAGLEEEHVVAAHGNFYGAHCVECDRPHDRAVVERAIFFDEEAYEEEGEAAGGEEESKEEEEEGGKGGKEASKKGGKKRAEFAPPRCRDARCGGLVKPSIVFFGEGLPRRFFERRRDDLPHACDLLIVVGTSLVVHPFAGLMHDVHPHTPRLLINRERVGEARRGGGGGGGGASRGFVFEAGAPGGGRDVLYEGDADQGVRELARLCGWGQELEAMVEAATGAIGAAGAAGAVGADDGGQEQEEEADDGGQKQEEEADDGGQEQEEEAEKDAEEAEEEAGEAATG